MVYVESVEFDLTYAFKRGGNFFFFTHWLVKNLLKTKFLFENYFKVI